VEKKKPKFDPFQFVKDQNQKILYFFHNDSEKASLWWGLPNPSLGNVPPILMVNARQHKKLERFIDSSLADNVQEEEDTHM